MLQRITIFLFLKSALPGIFTQIFTWNEITKIFRALYIWENVSDRVAKKKCVIFCFLSHILISTLIFWERDAKQCYYELLRKRFIWSATIYKRALYNFLAFTSTSFILSFTRAQRLDGANSRSCVAHLAQASNKWCGRMIMSTLVTNVSRSVRTQGSSGRGYIVI